MNANRQPAPPAPARAGTPAEPTAADEARWAAYGDPDDEPWDGAPEEYGSDADYGTDPCTGLGVARWGRTAREGTP